MCEKCGNEVCDCAVEVVTPEVIVAEMTATATGTGGAGN